MGFRGLACLVGRAGGGEPGSDLPQRPAAVPVVSDRLGGLTGLIGGLTGLIGGLTGLVGQAGAGEPVSDLAQRLGAGSVEASSHRASVAKGRRPAMRCRSLT